MLGVALQQTTRRGFHSGELVLHVVDIFPTAIAACLESYGLLILGSKFRTLAD